MVNVREVTHGLPNRLAILCIDGLRILCLGLGRTAELVASMAGIGREIESCSQSRGERETGNLGVGKGKG